MNELLYNFPPKTGTIFNINPAYNHNEQVVSTVYINEP